MMRYTAPAWLPGGHLQTIWSARFAGPALIRPVAYQRERWTTPDQDFIDVDWLIQPEWSTRPLLVLFHGLESSSNSHYAQAFAAFAHSQNMAYVVPHFRGCSGEINRAPRAYHCGDYTEIGWILQRLQQQHAGPVLAVGVSLGGNALLRWAQEAGEQATQTVRAVASVCAPLDLYASGQAMGRGFNRYVYTPMFLRTMKPKALQKLAQFPGLFDKNALLAAKDLYAFDNVFTAPLHGFKHAQDYWCRASAKPGLPAIRLPTLVLNACNDPFVPSASLPVSTQVGSYVTLWHPRHGGHVGFAQGKPPGTVSGMPEQVGTWLLQHVN